MWENADHNNSKYGDFLRSVIFLFEIAKIIEVMENVKKLKFDGDCA